MLINVWLAYPAMAGRSLGAIRLSQLCTEIGEVLHLAVKRNLSDAILLSGGLDTSIIATLASRMTRLSAVTLALDGAEKPDLYYARLVARRLGIRLTVKRFGLARLEAALKTVVKTLRTFDPMEVRNSAAIQIGLESFRDMGIRAVMTGDGGDELFAGYSFFFKMAENELEQALERMQSNMHFSSFDLASNLCMEVRAPFLDEEVMELARRVPASLKVRRHNNTTYGKWILRKTFAGLLPEETVWRVKLPIEIGVGTTSLTKLCASRITSESFETEKRRVQKRDGVDIRDPEHMRYYRIFREYFGVPKQVSAGQRACRSCGSAIEIGIFCRVCGEYPAV